MKERINYFDMVIDTLALMVLQYTKLDIDTSSESVIESSMTFGEYIKEAKECEIEEVDFFDFN